MAIVKKDFLFDIIKRTNKVYWEVKDGNTLIDSYEELNGDSSKSIEQLDLCLMAIESGYVTVQISERTKADKHEKPGNLRNVNSTYRVKCGEDITQRIIDNNGAGNSAEIDRLNRVIIELKHQHELEAIKRDFNERLDALDDSEDDGIGSVLTKQIAPHIPAILMSLTGINISQSPSLNGTHEDDDNCKIGEVHVIDKDTEKSKCIKAVNQLLQQDKLAGTHLLKLADLSVNKPEVYKMALGYLNTL